MRARGEQSVVLSSVLQVIRTLSGNDRAEADEPLSLFFPDSLSSSAFIAELGRTLGRQLPATLFWDCRTGRDLARWVTVGDGSSASSGATASRALEPIAVIGMACRFPGAQGLDEYWRLLSEGRNEVVECPPDRAEDVLGDFGADIASNRGGYLRDVDQFDAEFFGLSRREAVAMDPQQRLLLEITYEALENSGMSTKGGGDRFGVFIGAMWNDYARLFGSSDLSSYSATGLDLSILSARLSHHFGWEGPSLTVNTACSSSLVAIQMGCESLLIGESDVAIAGGVNLILSPYSGVALTKFGALSSSGRCSSFDAAADGYVRGEGCGIVVLKRLSDAISNGDRVLGIISGWAVNNNGLSVGLTAPSRLAQEKLLRAALAKSSRAVDDVTYVEAHGTGTILGDPIEAQALAGVYGAGRSKARPLLLGSVKTNIGHLESAAGIAGLIKVLLAIGKRRIPKQLHFSTANPHIDFAGSHLKVVSEAIDWTDEVGPLCAGVSSFGFGGTNCHLVVESGAAGRPRRRRGTGVMETW